MIITVDWDDAEQTILLIALTGTWDADDFRDGIEAIRRNLQEATHPVDLLVCVTDKALMNPPGWVIRIGRDALLGAPMNTGMLVITPNNTAILAFTEIGIQLLGNRYTGKLHTAATVDDARRLIRAHR